MFNEINSIEPGEVLIFDIYNHRIEKRKKFLPFFISNPTGDDISYSLENSIRRRTKGHDSFALSLSGGVDSNLILLNCLKLGLSVTPFTVRWPGSDKSRYNLDAQVAANVSKALGVNLNIIDMPNAEQVPEILDDYVKSISSPNSNPTAISMMVLYSEIHRMNFRLVLTGDGSDEVFGGYRRYQLSKATNLIPKINNRFLKKILMNKDLKSVFPSKLAYAVSPNNSVESWLYWHLIASNNTIHKMVRGIPDFDVSISSTDLSTIFTKSNNGVRHLMFNDLKTWLSMESNRKLDSISMRYSIEARSPFQDENLIGIGYRAMEKSNFNLVNKELLFKAFPNLFKIPINKNKMGFISPFGFWLRSNPELIKNSTQNLNSYFDIDQNEVEILTRSPKLGDYNGFKLLWSLIVLERWLAVNY
jgi:asparagine synthase (glutamine-hydrolysing)